MFTALVSFSTTAGDQPQVLDAAVLLLGAWYKNGQIVDQSLMTSVDRKLYAYVSLPDRDALDSRFANKYVERELECIRALGCDQPAVEILGTDPSTGPPCECSSRRTLILFTTYLGVGSPLHCGDCFGPVPLYRIPPTEDAEYLNVLHWQADYKACDTLQMHCTTGERFAEQQLARHDSSLSKQGREICARLAAKTGAKVYYYLWKGRGRTLAKERLRRCPSCGRKWMLSERWHGLFDFRCEKCSLVSNIALGLPG